MHAVTEGEDGGPREDGEARASRMCAAAEERRRARWGCSAPFLPMLSAERLRPDNPVQGVDGSADGGATGA